MTLEPFEPVKGVHHVAIYRAVRRLSNETSWTQRIFPFDAPAAARAPSRETIVSVVILLGVWRLSILAFSFMLDRVGRTNCGWGVPVPWKYSACWDTQMYIDIAWQGYDYTPDAPSRVAFFPLYPLLMRIFDEIIPGPGAVLAGLVAGHLALLIAAIYIVQLLRIDFSDTIARRTLYYLLIFPSAIFFSAAYSEPVFLLAIAGSLYHARRGQWIRAGLFAAGGSATKLIGLLLVIPLAVEAVTQRTIVRQKLSVTAGLALAPFGALAYFAFLEWRFGDFRAFFNAQENWGRNDFSPLFFMGIERLLGDARDALTYYPTTITPIPSAFLLADTTLLVLFVVAGVILWRNVRPSYGALVLFSALGLGFAGNPQSLNRYLVVLFPAFILLARIRSEPLRAAISIVFLFGLGLETYFFVNALWAG